MIDVIASVNEARSDDLLNRTVIVIDVLRATSTLIAALAHGASAVIPAETVNIAKGLRAPGDLLAGERYCKRIAGFDYGNSPLEFADSPDAIQGRRIIMTTTNGTLAVQKCQRAANVLAACFLNAAGSAAIAAGLKRDISILCAGTKGSFALEDGLCAGLIVQELLAADEPPEINDFGRAMLAAYRSHADDLENALFRSSNGKKLCKLGFSEDISYCGRLNVHSIVPVLKDGALTPYPGSKSLSLS